MKIAPLTVVEASAGTGKTYALVTRLMTLIFGGVEPERIVALTFSRLAAGEIFNSFIERLSNAAEDAGKAAEESAALALGRTLTQADFAAMLRKVVARQHLSLIGTLDSFLMRVVRMLPFELGLAGEVTILSEYRTPLETARLVGDMLMLETADAKDVFRKAFRLVFGGAGARDFLSTFSRFIDAWHARFRDRPDRAEWGDPSRIWSGGTPPPYLDCTLGDIRAQAAAFAAFAEKRGVAAFAAKIAAYAGGALPNLPKALAENPAARTVLQKMCACRIAQALRTTQGVYFLMWIFERAYAAAVRSRGLVTFDDLPRLLAHLPEPVRLNLEYRMDAKFDHWALDEFQDTSRGQWRAISNIIAENSQPDGDKTVFIVGDRKQSIYEWRAGDVRILGEQVERAKRAPNSLLSRDESHRYRREISAAVNQIFETRVIRGLFDMDDAPANAVWECREHVSHDRERAGFVEVSEAPKAGKTVKMEDFFAPVAHALAAVRPWERGISTAILVRKNAMGAALLAYLKQDPFCRENGLGDHVVFEGDTTIFDSPVLGAFAALLKLAEHADDTFAYAQIRCSPLARALYPDGLPDPAALSAALLADFTRLGMVRTFRAVREALKSVPGTWDDSFTESRFEDFLKCAVEFESVRDATMRLSDFLPFVADKKRRDFADASKVRILTMHRSKGLGFDYVIIPFYEREGLSGSTHPDFLSPLAGEAPDWLLKHPGVDAAESDPVLRAAERRRRQTQVYSGLCIDYVALTRAKKALTLILHPAAKTAKGGAPERFSDLVRTVGLKTAGDPAWYLQPDDASKNGSKAPEIPPTPPVFTRPPRQACAKSRPGEAFRSGIRGDTLFAENFGEAARKGTARHEAYGRIAWLDAHAARTPFEKALVKPADATALWRERAYERIVDGVWQSGRFDRVVFAGTGAARRAVIYDFKTNARQGNESPAAFAERMVRTYAAQMHAYRRALASLANLPLDRVQAVLLLEATQDAVQL